MTKKDSVLIKSFVVCIVLVLLAAVVTIGVTQKTATQPPAKATSSAGILPTVSPPPTPPQPTVVETDVHSSKADKKLILRTTTNRDGTSMYEFFIADVSGGNERRLFAKTLGPGAVMALPFNAWDPTDTYVFLEQRTQGVPDYFVFRTDGSPFAGGNTYVDVGAVWTQKKIGYTIREATGWASDTLLIIYTLKDDGTHGPAYWFEIPSTAIIQLWR